MQSSGMRHWIQQHISWPLLLALVCSLSIHLLVIEQIDWRRWFVDTQRAPAELQARLMPVLPAVLPKPAQPEEVLPRAPKAKPAQAAPAHAQPLPPPAALVEPLPVPGVDEPSITQEALAETRLADIQAWHEMVPPAVENDEPQAPPYQRVNTEFAVFVNGEQRPAGSAKIEYVRDTPDTYHLRWQVEGRGLLKLLYPSLEQVSEGEVTPRGLKPQHYRYAFGSRSDKTYEASFDWETNIISLKTSKGEQRLDLRVNTQDILSFMYQFMFVPPLEEMHVTLTNGRRLGEYEYRFEGEDVLVIADQTIQTVHISHTRGDTDEKVELWLASDFRYVPVKIKKLEKNGMVIEQVATRLVTE